MNPVTQPFHLLTVQRLARVGSWELDLASQTVYWSGELRCIAGLPPDSDQPLPLETIFQLIHPEDREALEHAIITLINTGRPIQIAYRLLRPNGEVRYLEGRAEAVYDAQGRIVRLMGAEQDITERKQIEFALRQEETRFRVMFEQAPIGMNQVDAWGQFVRVNAAFCQFLKFSEAELLQMTVKAVTHPEDWQAGQQYITELNAGQRHQYTLEKRYICKDGEVRWASLSVCRITSESAQLQFTIAIVQDISDRKAAELILQQQARRQQALNRVIQAIRDSLDLDKILATAVVEICTLLEVDQAGLMRYVPERQVWVNAAYHTQRQGMPSPVGLEVPDVNNPMASKMKALEIVCIDESSRLSDPINQEIANLFPGAWLLIPLQLPEGAVPHTGIWGNLVIVHNHPGFTWQETQIELAVAVADQIQIAIQQTLLYEQLQQANQELHRMARTDSLTQIGNRRSFDEMFLGEWQRAAQLGTPLGLIFCDIDHFKRFNDTHGHLQGDACLAQLAQTLLLTCSDKGQQVARYGGEEFAILLRDTSLEQTRQQAEAIRLAIRRLRIADGNDFSHPITVSLGVSAWVPQPDQEMALLIQDADQALYEAKRLGRDRVCIGSLSSGHKPDHQSTGG